MDTRYIALLMAAALLTAGPSADAQPHGDNAPAPDPDELVWRWRPLAWYDYAVTGALVTGAAIELALPPGSESDEATRSGGVLIDDAVRDALVLGSNDDRHAVGSLSDFTLTLLVTYPFVVDAALVGWWVRDSPAVAWQMTVIDLQSLAFTSLMTGALKRAVDRERPVATACGRDPTYDQSCDAADKHYSFPSGHTSMSFTGASLICLHHAELGLYGQAGDTIACAGGMLAASMTGLSRIAADKHYLSDVLSGALLGGISGGLMPWLLYYAWDTPPSADSAVVLPVVTDDQIGLSWTGLL